MHRNDFDTRGNEQIDWSMFISLTMDDKATHLSDGDNDLNRWQLNLDKPTLQH